ncbi:MAG: phospholipase [Hyphomonadaceae bacterium]
MEEREFEILVAVLPPLFGALEALEFIARHLNPAELASVLERAMDADAGLREARPRLAEWGEPLAALRARLEEVCDHVFVAFDGVRAAPAQENYMLALFRALRFLPRAEEALYPLAAILPPVNRFFLDPALRGNPEIEQSLFDAAPREDAGLAHIQNEPKTRGGVSFYAPENYAPERAWPLIVALHGGSGHGRSFLWSWLREARGRGAILIAPTSVGETWALMGEDEDTPNLHRIVAFARRTWNIDPARILLTGMSDGGTFSLVSGLQEGAPFTHLAPMCGTFHPMLAQMADPERARGLPIYLVHGAHDWMFPVTTARAAERALTAAGARVNYREIADLSHCYPREESAAALDWLMR